MGKISIATAKEMLQIFCKKYEIEGEMQEDENGGTLISPIWCKTANRTCALGFVLDDSDGSLTLSFIIGRVKDETANSYMKIINENEPGGFSAIIANDGLFMLGKKISYQTDENFFSLLLSLLQQCLTIMDSEIVSLCAKVTNPL